MDETGVVTLISLLCGRSADHEDQQLTAPFSTHILIDRYDIPQPRAAFAVVAFGSILGGSGSTCRGTPRPTPEPSNSPRSWPPHWWRVATDGPHGQQRFAAEVAGACAKVSRTQSAPGGTAR